MKLATIIIFIAALFTISQSKADVIYHWEGTCSVGCTGKAQATLSLADGYLPGTSFQIGSTPFLTGFTYQDSTWGITIAGNSTPTFRGADWEGFGSLPNFIQLHIVDQYFAVSSPTFSQAVGQWHVGFNGNVSRGTGGVFTLQGSVPEPSTLALVGLALLIGGLGWNIPRQRKIG